MAVPNVEVFVSSKQSPADIPSVVNMFTGTGTMGLTARVSVIAPTERPGCDADYSMVLDAFERASPNAYVVVCKDVATSASPSTEILDTIHRTILAGQQPGDEFDLFFLAGWLDRCDLYTNIREIGAQGLKLVDTVSPNGVLCIMFSPQGRQKFMAAFDPSCNPIVGRPLGQVLNSRVTSRTSASATDTTRPISMQGFFATTCTPHIIVFDVTKRKSDAELLKMSECRDIPVATPPKCKTSSNLGFFWFIVVLIVVILLVWALVKIGTRYSYSTATTDVIAVDSGFLPPPVVVLT